MRCALISSLLALALIGACGGDNGGDSRGGAGGSLGGAGATAQDAAPGAGGSQADASMGGGSGGSTGTSQSAIAIVTHNKSDPKSMTPKGMGTISWSGTIKAEGRTCTIRPTAMTGVITVDVDTMNKTLPGAMLIASGSNMFDATELRTVFLVPQDPITGTFDQTKVYLDEVRCIDEVANFKLSFYDGKDARATFTTFTVEIPTLDYTKPALVWRVRAVGTAKGLSPVDLDLTAEITIP